MRIADHHAQRLQHRGVQVVIQRRHMRVVAVDCQQVLGQVVGADREEVDQRRHLADLEHGGRDLDHHADLRQQHVDALLAHLAMGAVDQAQRLFQLLQAADHRQQDAQVVQPGAGLEHGAHLHQEDFRVIEGDADAAPAEEGVLLLDGEIRQRLVAADIQRAHGHRLRVEGHQLLAVDRRLFLLAGEAVMGHERHFTAIQADALGTTLLGAADVGEQAGIHPQRHAMAVGGLAWQVAQGIEVEIQLALGLGDAGELLAQCRRRVGVQLAPGAVDDDFQPVEHGVGQIDHAHHGGDAHGARQDGDVGVA